MIQPAALVEGHQHIASPMHDKQRRSLFFPAEIIHGNCSLGQFRIFQHVFPADDKAFRTFRPDMILYAGIIIHFSNICRAIPVHDAVYRGRLLPVSVHIRRIISCKTGRQGRMSSAGIPPQSHLLRIYPVPGGIDSQKAYCRFGILHLRRKRRNITGPVFHNGDGIAPLAHTQKGRQMTVQILPVPGGTLDKHDKRPLPVRLFHRSGN